MKGFILVDFPRYCVDCKFCREINEGTEACCEMTVDPDEYDCYRMIDDYFQSKPQWCPIKEIPVRLEEIKCPHSMSDYQRKGFSRGFNACLDEIEGR